MLVKDFTFEMLSVTINRPQCSHLSHGFMLKSWPLIAAIEQTKVLETSILSKGTKCKVKCKEFKE